MGKMKRFTKWLFLICLALNSCNSEPSREGPGEKLKNELIQAEVNFAKMAKEEGVPQAFLAFAADDAVLNRNDTLVKGKEAIQAYFTKQTLEDVNLSWTPDFVDVAKSGDLGYTYGHYRFSAIDTTGKNIQIEGVFHTVWKRQPDGNWRFVWD